MPRNLKAVVMNFPPTRITATMGGDMWNDATGQPFIIEQGGEFFMGRVTHTVQNGNMFVLTVENFVPMDGNVEDWVF
jgi:hypothetical protein